MGLFKKGMLKIGLSFAIIIVLYACGPNVEFKQMQLVEASGWDMNDTLLFDLPIEHTQQSYNLLLNLDYETSFAYSNLFFFVDVTDPKKETYRDTIECILALPNGKWLGDVSGEKVEQSLIYRYNINFPDKGTYKIALQHAMRDTVLKHVNAIGFELRDFENE
jgi:gliding motility-associated lipoprotein GldH